MALALKLSIVSSVVLMIFLWQIGFLNWLAGGRIEASYKVTSALFIGAAKRSWGYYPKSWRTGSWARFLINLPFVILLMPIFYVFDLLFLLVLTLAARFQEAWEAVWDNDTYFDSQSTFQDGWILGTDGSFRGPRPKGHSNPQGTVDPTEEPGEVEFGDVASGSETPKPRVSDSAPIILH